MSTIRTYVLAAAEKNGDGVAVRWKAKGEWMSVTHGERLARVRNVSELVGRLGIRPGQQVALMMPNRIEWMDIYLGLACCGITVVPLDAKFHEKEASHILRDSEAAAWFVSGHLLGLAREITAGLPALRNIVVLDGAVPPEGITEDGIHPVRYSDYATLLAAAKEDSERTDCFFALHEPMESDTASLLYTSGTTGRPKGAMLTHANFVSQIEGGRRAFRMYPWDNFLLVLPLHHAFAFSTNFLIPIGNMCEVSIVENLRTIAENMREVHPTFLLAVPLLTEKLLGAVMSKLRKNRLAMLLMRLGLTKVVGKKVIEGFGGRLRVIVSGGAAADPEILRSIKAFGITTYEGYGLTETSPMCAISPEKDIRNGTVGKAMPGCELRIVGANSEGVGEIEVRGPNVMKGYFHNEAATAEAFDGEWFRTGDLGKLDSDGYLSITGRKKSLIVNREGKNIYPEEVEEPVNAAPHILESLVLGYHAAGEKGERVGIILVPDMDAIVRDFSSKLSDDEIAELCKKELYDAVKILTEYKRPRRVQIRFEPFEKTTTLKIKRYLYSLPVE